MSLLCPKSSRCALTSLQQVRALLSGDELTEWDRAAAAAKAEGSFFIGPAAPLRRRYKAGLRSTLTVARTAENGAASE